MQRSVQAVAFLERLGAARIQHPGGTLLEHLQRVGELLGEWRARSELRLAGLCHAFYGTDGFARALLPLDRRDELRAVVGQDTEELVYFYASCDREFSYPGLADATGAAPRLFRDRFTGRAFVPSPQWRRDLAELTAANELDLARNSLAFRDRHGAELLKLLTGFRPLLSERAWRECEITLG